MRVAFKNTHLITNQGVFHGVANQDPSCQRHVVNYLETGEIAFVDGQVCGSDFASSDALFGVFASGLNN